jgi:hypothetical protein
LEARRRQRDSTAAARLCDPDHRRQFATVFNNAMMPSLVPDKIGDELSGTG